MLTLIKDLGMQFPTETSKQKKRFGLYQCSCGATTRAMTYKVTSNKTQSCGCYHKQRTSETHKKHGLKTHSLYVTWSSIKTRCYNTNRKCYTRYGAKDITMCDEWVNDFMKFYNWSLANGWEQGLHIDKDILCLSNSITPKVYGPDTCMWITRKQNNPANVPHYVFYLKLLKRVVSANDVRQLNIFKIKGS